MPSPMKTSTQYRLNRVQRMGLKPLKIVPGFIRPKPYAAVRNNKLVPFDESHPTIDMVKVTAFLDGLEK